MAGQASDPNDFVHLSRFALRVHRNLSQIEGEFAKLNLDVKALLVNIGTLDKSPLRELIKDYVGDAEDVLRDEEVIGLRDGLNSCVFPFWAIFDEVAEASRLDKSGITTYTFGPNLDTDSKAKSWKRWKAGVWKRKLIAAFDLKDLSSIHNRLTLYASNLNIFLTKLTQTQIQRQTQLLTLRLSEESLLGTDFRYSSTLAKEEDEFRRHVARYVRFLLDGGKPLSDDELDDRKDRHGYPYRRRYGSSSTSSRKPDPDTKRKESRVRWDSDWDGISKDAETMLDEDARVKLSAARRRLSLSTLKDYEAGPSDSSSDEGLTKVRSPLDTSKSETIIIPRFKPSKDPRKSSVSSLKCDVCGREIEVERVFYRCESGKCGGKRDSYDVCRRCYEDDYRCPGVKRGSCRTMEKVMLEEFD